jgi:membrane-bound lytic murein transglycosylase A
MRYKLATISINLPIILFFLLAQIQPLGHRKLSPLECRFSKWNIPESLPSTLQPLIQRKPITCCQTDLSCLDKFIYQEDNSEITQKKALITSIDRSLKYLQTLQAVAAYQRYQLKEITRDRIIKSLKRFRELLINSQSATELHAAIEKEFVYYQSVGKDQKGTVLFTAYYEPLYIASRVPTAEFRYPVYRLPPDLKTWPQPHPTRLQLEGADGLQAAKGKLRGLELFWFRDRLEPYMIQIQGSAKLQLTDGTATSIGYAGNTTYNYKSIGRELANDGKLPLQGMTMPIILDYFQKHPPELNIYIPRDPSPDFSQAIKNQFT